MEEQKRVRVVFKDNDILSEAQKAEGLNRSWVLLKLQQRSTISDVVSHLLQVFQLYQSCPHGLLLSMRGFMLPPFESTCMLKDNEIIRVIKRRNVLSIEGSNAAVASNKLKTLEKQKLHNGVLLLANEQFRKEKIDLDCDSTEEETDEEDEDLLEVGPVDPIIRKRKATESFQTSKKRKRIEAPGIIANSVLTENMENSYQNGIIRVKKIDDFCAEDHLEDNEEIPPSDKSNAAMSDIKLSVDTKSDVQENDNVTEDSKVQSKEAKKVQSRSARRKSVKRRWMAEMANIWKKNAACESEGLKNWKEDRAKAERTRDLQPRRLKWKKPEAEAEKQVIDGQPKGLLHWKQSSQMNYNKGKKRYQQKQAGQNHSGFEHEQIVRDNGDEHEEPSFTEDDVHEQNPKKSDSRLEQPSQTDNASKLSLKESDEEGEVVPILIRPGHIRFEPSAEEDVQQLNHVTLETIHWNGITSKKKGQKWGLANSSFSPKKDFNTPNKERSKILNNKEEKSPVDFNKLPNLSSVPKEDDIIVYRILELSSTWTPELSAFRVGKVSRYNVESNLMMLVPVPEYPVVLRNEDEDNELLPDNQIYKEDGSLEVDFSSLVDVRIMNHGVSRAKELASNVLESSLDQENALSLGLSENDEHAGEPTTVVLLSPSHGQETQTPIAEKDGLSIWDQISKALDAKKEQLSQESSWGKRQSHLVPRNRYVKTANKAENNRGKNAKSVQGENNHGNQNMGNKSWSYKALRGSGLGQTMNILRSTKEI